MDDDDFGDTGNNFAVGIDTGAFQKVFVVLYLIVRPAFMVDLSKITYDTVE